MKDLLKWKCMTIFAVLKQGSRLVKQIIWGSLY